MSGSKHTLTHQHFFSVAIFAFSLLSTNLWAADAAPNFHWPKHYKAAVVLGYDDALNSQLDHAIPSLNKYHLKGTFFVILNGPVIANRMEEWRKAAKEGHELANHTLFHQCGKSQPGRDWVLPADDLDKISVEQMVEQVTVANTMLHAIDGKNERTMTTPCFDQKAAGGINYVEAIKSKFVAIRDNGGGALTPDMNTIDPAYVTTTAPMGVTGKQLIAIVEEAAAKGTMVNITFHGIGGDHIVVSTEAHEELLKYLADHKDIYWTDTFLNIMKYVREQRKI